MNDIVVITLIYSVLFYLSELESESFLRDVDREMCGTINAGEGNCVMDTNWQPNLCNTVKSSTDINFLSDDMAVHEDNQKWRSSVQQALDKLSAKTNVTTSDGTTIR